MNDFEALWYWKGQRTYSVFIVQFACAWLQKWIRHETKLMHDFTIWSSHFFLSFKKLALAGILEHWGSSFRDRKRYEKVRLTEIIQMPPFSFFSIVVIIHYRYPPTWLTLIIHYMKFHLSTLQPHHFLPFHPNFRQEVFDARSRKCGVVGDGGLTVKDGILYGDS